MNSNARTEKATATTMTTLEKRSQTRTARLCVGCYGIAQTNWVSREEEIRSRLENGADSNRWIGSGACLEPDVACSAQRMKRSSIEAIVPDETAFSRRDFHVLS